MNARSRLLAAAALCFVALGLGWAATAGSEGYVTSGTITPGFCTSTYDGYLDCTAGTYQAGFYIPGSPEGAARGYEADARVVLVPAVAILLWAARRRTPASVRAVQVTAVALAVVAVRAAGEGQVAGALVGAAAVALLVSALRSPPGAGLPVEGPPAARTVDPAPGTAF